MHRGGQKGHGVDRAVHILMPGYIDSRCAHVFPVIDLVLAQVYPYDLPRNAVNLSLIHI